VVPMADAKRVLD